MRRHNIAAAAPSDTPRGPRPRAGAQPVAASVHAGLPAFSSGLQTDFEQAAAADNSPEVHVGGFLQPVLSQESSVSILDNDQHAEHPFAQHAAQACLVG